MRHFHTSVVERREEFSGEFAIQPLECAWASEAIYFVQVEGGSAGAVLELAPQISVDGTRWLDEGSRLPPFSDAGSAFLRLSHFGGWLRLRGRVAEGESVTLTVHLVLKE